MDHHDLVSRHLIFFFSCSTGSVRDNASETGAIAGAVVGSIVVIVFAIVVITYCCRQRTKNIANAKAYELQLVGPGNSHSRDFM